MPKKNVENEAMEGNSYHFEGNKKRSKKKEEENWMKNWMKKTQ